jgi:hypothetical protein
MADLMPKSSAAARALQHARDACTVELNLRRRAFDRYEKLCAEAMSARLAESKAIEELLLAYEQLTGQPMPAPPPPPRAADDTATIDD